MRTQLRYEDHHVEIENGAIVMIHAPDVYIDGQIVPTDMPVMERSRTIFAAFEDEVRIAKEKDPNASITRASIMWKADDDAWEDWCRRHSRPTKFSLLPGAVQHALKCREMRLTRVETSSVRDIFDEYLQWEGIIGYSNTIFDIVRNLLAIEGD